MLKIKVLALSFCILLSSFAYAQNKEISSYTIDTAIKRALEENPKLDIARTDIKMAEYDLRSSYGALLPSVNANFSAARADVAAWYSNTLYQAAADYYYGPGTVTLPDTGRYDATVNVFSWSIVATQPLFTGFALLNQVDQAKLAKESTDLQYENANLQLVSSVQTAFIEFLRFEDMIKSTQRAIDRAQEQLNLTSAAFNLGLRPKIDVLQAQVDLAGLENTMIQVQNRREIFRTTLQALLVLPITDAVDFTGSLQVVPFNRSLEECINIAIANRPELKLGRLAVSMAETGKKITNAAYYPQIFLQAAYTEEGDLYKIPDDSRSYSIGIGMQWNIFSGGRRYNESRKADLNISKTRYALVDATNGIISSVKALYLTAEEARKRIAVTKQSIERAEENYTAAQARYELGVGTNLDLLLAQSSLASEESNHTSALADYLLAVSQLHIAMGEMYILDL